MSSARWWWANKAQELRFHQLDAVRRQAETWRTGLAGLTALVGATLLVKGRDNFAGLSLPYPVVVAALLGLALAALVLATLRALRAASGMPGDECLLTGEDLEVWTGNEVAQVQQGIIVARRLTLAGVCLLAAAVALGWFAPTRQQTGPEITVEIGNDRVCGALAGITDGVVVIRQSNQYRVIPLESATRITPGPNCAD